MSTPWPGDGTRAVLLVGYAGAFRRSELTGLTMDQLARRGDTLEGCIRPGNVLADNSARHLNLEGP